MKKLKLLALFLFIVFVRVVITKEPQILNMLASGNYKEAFEFVKCIVLKS